MGYGGNMKPTKVKTADLDRFKGDSFWGKVLMKLKKLGTAIEMKKGPQMDIDDVQYRWVDDRIKYMSKGGKYAYKFTREDMEQANEYWRIYG